MLPYGRLESRVGETSVDLKPGPGFYAREVVEPAVMRKASSNAFVSKVSRFAREEKHSRLRSFSSKHFSHVCIAAIASQVSIFLFLFNDRSTIIVMNLFPISWWNVFIPASLASSSTVVESPPRLSSTSEFMNTTDRLLGKPTCPSCTDWSVDRLSP